MNLEKRIKEERSKVSATVEQLKKENAIDQENLNELEQEYKSAVVSSDEEKIDRVNSQIKEVTLRMTRRKIKINAISDENNPVIQDMIIESLSNWQDEITILEEQAANKFTELEPLHKELLAGLNELDEMKHRVSSLRSVSKRYSHQLNQTNKKKVNFDEHVPNKVLSNMLPLLIERGNAFKVY